MSPAMPELLPVASDEHELLDTATTTRVEKFVQPLNCRYDGGTNVNVESDCVTELTPTVSAQWPAGRRCQPRHSSHGPVRCNVRTRHRRTGHCCCRQSYKRRNHLHIRCGLSRCPC